MSETSKALLTQAKARSYHEARATSHANQMGRNLMTQMNGTTHQSQLMYSCSPTAVLTSCSDALEAVMVY